MFPSIVLLVKLRINVVKYISFENKTEFDDICLIQICLCFKTFTSILHGFLISIFNYITKL